MPGLLDGWGTTVTPAPQAPPQASSGGGGLFSSLGSTINGALANPGFQFGLGMAGAGSEGKGLGGGLLGGAENAPNAWKIFQAQRQQKFLADMNDPNSPTYKAMAGSFSPAAMAAAQANPDLLGTLFKSKGDIEGASALARVNNQAEMQRQMAMLKYQQSLATQTLNQIPGISQYMPGGGGGAAPTQAPVPGTISKGYRFMGGDPSSQNSWQPVGAPQ